MSEEDFTLNAEPGEYKVQGAPIGATVDRVLDDVRLALLGILLSIGLSVGFGVPGSWCVGLASGVAATGIAVVALRWWSGALARFMLWLLKR
jgi:hypothetical protein